MAKAFMIYRMAFISDDVYRKTRIHCWSFGPYTHLSLLFVSELSEDGSDGFAFGVSNGAQTVSGVRSDHKTGNVGDNET